MTSDIALSIFDYAALDTETRIVVQQRTSELRTIARRAADDIVEIGQKLIDVKARLGHGNFGKWLEAEFAWSQDTAGRFMAVASRFTQIPHGAEFAPQALYLLAAPSVPDEARVEAIQRAEAGERITVATAKQIVERSFANAADLVEPVRNFALTAAHGEITVARAILKQIGDRSPQHLTAASDSPDLAPCKPFRLAELVTAAQQARAALPMPQPSVTTFAPGELAAGQPASSSGRAKCTVCGRPISDPASIARGAGDVCSGHPATNGNGHTPTIQPDPVDEHARLTELADAVNAWLDDKVEGLDLADGDDARRYALNAILASRNGSPGGGHNEAWRDLRASKHWPAGATPEEKLEGVRAALRLLNREPLVPPAPKAPAPPSTVGVIATPPASPVPAPVATVQPPAGGLVLTKLAVGLEQLIDELIACAAHLESLGCDANEHLASAIEQAQDLLTLAKGANA